MGDLPKGQAGRLRCTAPANRTVRRPQRRHRGKKAASILCRLVVRVPGARPRRTAATRMAEAGVSRDHIAKVLNLHASRPPGRPRCDDRYVYDAEKRDALERWARRFQVIIEGKTSKVVAMRAR